ncbi:histidine kinase [Actinokineospora bangkokensis]|uniref:Histidine kinase n=1 Tax=Actinokineospora bangkokensis TaxID=1193682 RepID=A0A1Q9LPH0_9PSEU|nr:histidine kinase [Actinokineospora bangkokensis]
MEHGDPHDLRDLFDNAPCGYLSTLPDGTITTVNATLLGWLGRGREELVGRLRFADLLTFGGKVFHETHFAPLLRMGGEVREIAFEISAADGRRLPVLVNAAVRAGADGEPRLVRITLLDATHRRAYEQELLRARQEADRERDAVERERARLQRLTEILQRTLLPPSLPPVPGLDAAAHYHVASSDRVGGDFYDLFPITPDRWGVFLGDVCGKGPDAAVLTSAARYTLRSAAAHVGDPAAVLANLNDVLLQQVHTDRMRFCTAVFGVLTRDGDGFTAVLASGGHPPPLLTRADGGVHELTTPGGQLIGVFPDVRVVTTTTRLGPGDTLLLYSDGLIEARGADGGMFGEQCLSELATAFPGRTAAAIADDLIARLTAYAPKATDDTAILVLTVPSAEPG